MQLRTACARAVGYAPRMMKRLSAVTRGQVIQIWLSAAILAIVGTIAFGAGMSLKVATVLCALSLVPPAIVLRLWQPAPA